MALIDFQDMVLIRPGAIDSLVKDEFFVSINTQIIIIQYVVLTQAPGIETNIVKLSSQIKECVGIDLIVHKGVSSRQQHALVILHPTHREGIIPALSIKQGFVGLAHSSYRIGFDARH